MPLRRRSRIRVALGLSLALLAAGATRSARAADSAPAVTPSAAEDEARLHFGRGRDLLREGAFDAALAEFLASRALVPTRGNTQNAAVCLRQLGRYDEALDLFEAMRRDFPLDDADRASVEGEIDRLRLRVGAVEVTASEPSAAVLVDGIERGRTPLAAPVRIGAGTHDVRVLKRGFRAFEAKVAVVGGQTTPLAARLEPLTSQGRLVVTEEAGRPARVEIDHALVGDTPWEGSLAPGVHVVVLHGDGGATGMGTQPVAAPVRVDEVTPLRLALEPLPGALRVEPQPASAHVVLDAVELGRGVWEGGVRAGGHVVEVTEEGYFPQRRAF